MLIANNIIMYLQYGPSLIGLDIGPTPRVVIAKIVTLISEDGGQSEDKILNTLPQNPSVQFEASI